MDIITSIIVVATPFVIGIASWSLVVIFNDVKDDISHLKKSTADIQTELVKHGVQITNLDSKVISVCKSVEEMRNMSHELDKRTANIQDNNVAIIKMTTRLDQYEKNYGKILVILDGLARRTGINFKKSGS